MTRLIRSIRIVSASMLTALLLVAPSSAAVKLPSIFTGNMVLQRDKAVPVWGWADPGEKVTVAFAGQTKSATADAASGKWTVTLEALKTSAKPRQLTVSASNTLTLNNVLVGEVWICSGQSNMAMTVARCNDADAEIAAANYSTLRLVTLPRVGTQEPQSDFEGEWVECGPATVGNFSAAAYYFGRKLTQELKIPIGLVHTSWGGSSCEAWVRRDVLEANHDFHALMDRWKQTEANYDHAKRLEQHAAALEKWKQRAAQAKANGKPAPRRPRNPQNPLAGQHRPANLYNGMIVPLLPLAARGAIWYQGESNAGRAYQYRSLFPTMIKNWRDDFGQEDLSFYFVQLANFRARATDPGESAWAELREAQSMTLSLPKSGQAVIIDIGEANDIHPKNKQDVGLRLALNALAKDYGRDVVYSGPAYKSAKNQGNAIVLSFDHVGGGLVAKGGELKSFAIAGADKKFVWADARIDGETIVVSSKDVAKPVAVRYAWAENPEATFYNKAGLPASPFRTDQWKGITVDVVK